MVQDLIRYDLLVQDAMRKVMGKVLKDVARDGLPGDHHFYISFKTNMPGVRISNAMRQKYPQDMMIALQYQYRDLAVHDDTFEVVLSFSGVPEKLVIPFDAITTFYDPSVQFALNFQPDSMDEDSEGQEDSGHSAEVTQLRKPEAEKPKKAAPPQTSISTSPSAVAETTKEKKPPSKIKKNKDSVATPKKTSAKEKILSSEPVQEKKSPKSKTEKPSVPEIKPVSPKKQDQGAEILRLDAFRKKRD